MKLSSNTQVTAGLVLGNALAIVMASIGLIVFTEKPGNDFRLLVWLIALSQLLFSAIFTFFFFRRFVMQPLDSFASGLRGISGTDIDFTVRLKTTGPDGIRDCALAFNTLMGRLQEIFGQIRSVLGQLLGTADGLDALSKRGVSSSAQASAETYSMAAQVEMLTFTLDGLASQADDVQRLSLEASNNSTSGGEVIHSAADEMRQIATTVNESSGIIQDLGRKSDQISQIVNVIKEIADQTNLLALNAAIEAARAGEQGRGFAVVADEVRKLAERTSNSTQEITSMIEQIQIGTGLAIQSMATGVSRVDNGATLAHKAGESINQIKVGIGQVVSAVNDISVSLKEQVKSNSENAGKVEKIARISDETNMAFEEAAKTTGTMDELARSLSNMMARFRT